MGGQACVLYGAAEFSRDTDFAILAEQENLDILRCALADLQAETIAVPPLAKENERVTSDRARRRGSDHGGRRSRDAVEKSANR
jgi:hypothetical protein